MPARRLLLHAFVMCILFSAGPTAAQTVVDASLPLPAKTRALTDFSRKLVEAAHTGKAYATAYRIDVAHYREILRDLVKENDARPEAERLPRALLLDMVRMAALLQSAAQCQTGRYIVCPPDLMSQLQRQQALLDQGVASLGAP